jgi:hypothetical protein
MSWLTWGSLHDWGCRPLSGVAYPVSVRFCSGSVPGRAARPDPPGRPASDVQDVVGRRGDRVIVSNDEGSAAQREHKPGPGAESYSVAPTRAVLPAADRATEYPDPPPAGPVSSSSVRPWRAPRRRLWLSPVADEGLRPPVGGFDYLLPVVLGRYFLDGRRTPGGKAADVLMMVGLVFRRGYAFAPAAR